MLQKFYHSTIRKSVIAFGNIFNNIFIDRLNSTGEVVQTIKIPLSYAPRQKFLARIEAEPNLPNERYQALLPRMAFEMTGLEYDGARNISTVQQNRVVNNTTNTLNTSYAPTPYKLQMSLYVYTKNQDDGLQIIEEILPYFNPDFNLTINTIPALKIKNDMQIILDSVNYDDQYEGDFRQRRAIVWTLNFTVKTLFYGPINKQGIIKTVYVDTFENPELVNRIQAYSVTADPADATKGNVTAYLETFTDFG